MENNKQFQNEEIEIDLLELFHALKKRWWAILLAMIMGGGAAGAFSKFALTPQFQSTAMLYVLSKETTLTSLADLQIGSQLTKDYKTIITSRPVLEGTLEYMEEQLKKTLPETETANFQLALTPKELAKKISIGNPADTRIITITAEDASPEMAKLIVDAMADTASLYIGNIMEMIPPKLIEDGELPTQKSSPSNGRNALLGAMAAAVAVCGIIVFEVIMNDTITVEDDVTKYLGLTVLASIPELEKGSQEGEETPSKSRRQQARRKH